MQVKPGRLSGLYHIDPQVYGDNCSYLSAVVLSATMPHTGVTTLNAEGLTLNWRLALPEVVQTLLHSDPELHALCVLS